MGKVAETLDNNRLTIHCYSIAFPQDVEYTSTHSVLIYSKMYNIIIRSTKMYIARIIIIYTTITKIIIGGLFVELHFSVTRKRNVIVLLYMTVNVKLRN